MSQAGSQDDGEYEVIIVDENNSSILADHDVTSSGPPSTKVSKHPLPISSPARFNYYTVTPFTKHVKRILFVREMRTSRLIDPNCSQVKRKKKKKSKHKNLSSTMSERK